MSPLFFRNDDVADLTPELKRVTDLFLERNLPLHHAVIPCRATDALVAWLRGLAEGEPVRIGVDLHGWNHETFRGKPEFGPGVPASLQRDHLARGGNWMRERFGARFSGILVPPHNSYNRTTVRLLDELGYVGLSGWVRRHRRLGRLLQPLRYRLDRDELWDWNGRPFPGTRVTQCSVTIDPVLDYRAGTLMEVSEVCRLVGSSQGPVAGICLHAWIFDGARLGWLGKLLDALSGTRVIRMADVVAGAH